jgi:DNA repair exonuclease SbcCD ATPase subunit
MNEPICLNSGLNAIIGGKSTGKSLLLHFIAKTLLPKGDKRLGVDKYSVKDKKNNKNESFFENFYDFDFEVEFGDGKKITLKNSEYYTDKNGDKQVILNNTLIEFIPQQGLSDMVENHNKNEIENPYQKLIEKSLSEQQGYEEVKKQHEEKCNELQKQVENKLIQLFEIQKLIKDLEKERAEMGNQQDFEASIQNIEQEIKNLKASSSVPDEKNKEFEDLQKQKLNTLQKIKILKDGIEALKNYKEKLQVDWKKFMNEVDENYKNVTQNFGLSDDNFLESIKKSLDDLNRKFQENIQEIETKESSFLTENIILDSQKLQIETNLKPFEDTFANFKKIEVYQKNILDYKQKIEKIEKQESSIKIKNEEFNICKENIKNTFKNLFEEYQNYIADLNKEYSTISKADKDNKDLIELHSELGFDYESFNNNFLSHFNRQSSQKNKDIFSGDDFFDENSKIIKENYINYANKIFDFLLPKAQYDGLKDGKTPKMTIESLFENRFKIDYKIKYENDWLENMSQGKKGIVLLKLYLAIEKAHYPILIDQPEDNLDNRTIYTSLIEFIKKRKIDRQIIMVTHNANLVIATDAEQVIVAHQEVLPETDEKTQDKKFKFKYVTGALEHTKKKDEKTTAEILYQQGIREHVCEILEGGEIAFKKREEKYGIK